MYCCRRMLSFCCRRCIQLGTQFDQFISKYGVCGSCNRANRSLRGKYVYELPKNVTEVHEVYLDDVDWSASKKRRKRMKKEQYQALRGLILNQKIEWNLLFDIFQEEDISLNDLLMGEDFLRAVMECYRLKYSQVVFSDFLWTMRSIYLPLLLS